LPTKIEKSTEFGCANLSARYRDQLPFDYKPFDKIWKALADAYLTLDDSLLKQNRTTQAQSMLKRATALMRNGSNS
jgi:hypothetical protein